MYHAKTSGSAASNMTFSRPSALMILATASVRQALTFSVIPSDSIISMSAPASRKRFACQTAHSTSRVPSASNSAMAVAAPAPHLTPAGAELDADLRLGLEPGLLCLLDQSQ